MWSRESSIGGYLYALSTDGVSDDVYPWTPARTTPEALFAGLVACELAASPSNVTCLERRVRYYCLARAFNRAGGSTTVASDGLTFEQERPNSTNCMTS